MELTVLELDDRDMMVICFLLICKRETILKSILWTAVIRNHFLDCLDSTRNELRDRAFPWRFF